MLELVLVVFAIGLAALSFVLAKKSELVAAAVICLALIHLLAYV